LNRFIRIISIVLFISILVALNVFFYKRSVDFSKIYPFNRTLLDNTITGKIDNSNTAAGFKTRIIKIENENADPGNIIDLLSKYSDKDELKILFEKEGLLFEKKVKTRVINREYLVFLYFLLLFGNIHYLWAGVVFFIRPHESRSKLFSLSSLALGLFYLNLIERFTFSQFNLLFIIIILFLGYLLIRLGSDLTNQGVKKIISAFVLICACTVIIYYSITTYFYRSIDSLTYGSLLIYLIICSLFTLERLLYGIIKGKYAFVIRRNLMLFISLFAGCLLPVLNVLFSAFSDSSLPIHLFSGLSLFFPLIAGNSFIKYNKYDFSGFKIFKLNDLKQLLINMIVAVICAVLLYSILTISAMYYHVVLFSVTVFTIIIILFNAEHILLKIIRNSSYENKDHYAFSAQKIAELSSSSKNIDYKLIHIYSEISDLTGSLSVKLLLFLNEEDEYYLNLSNYIEALPKSSELFSLMNLNKGIILKYALIKNSATEDKVYDFFRRKNFIFAIPMIEKNEIKGALLLGKKRYRGFYSDEDIHFLQSVMYQISQLIEIDKLYKEYILKKQYEKELDNASYVQSRLFPKAALKNRGIYISFFYRPYLRVIGDYFDFFKVDEDRTAVIIGDVSGHGLSTAMVLSAVNSITHTMLAEEKKFEKTFIEINNYLNNSYRGIELITLFIGIFNRRTKVMEYINAGHGAPILIKKDENNIRHIEGRSKILGADPSAGYKASRITLEKDDELILYTDGIMEIYNETTGMSLDEENFIQIIIDNIEKDIDGKIIEIEKKIKFHSKDIKDDITIIGVKVL
jgi:phosphoserine phosphatase RsbU/P